MNPFKAQIGTFWNLPLMNISRRLNGSVVRLTVQKKIERTNPFHLQDADGSDTFRTPLTEALALSSRYLIQKDNGDIILERQFCQEQN